MTVRNPDDGKRWRLKGALYEHDFEPERLTSRLQRRLETERAEIEAPPARGLKVLGESLSGVATSALRTIEAYTAAATGRMHGMLLRAWLRPLLVGLSLSVGICGGSWAARLLWTAIEWKVETLAALNLDIEQARQTLTEIEETTWGLELEIDGARYVVLPAGTLSERRFDDLPRVGGLLRSPSPETRSGNRGPQRGSDGT